MKAFLQGAIDCRTTVPIFVFLDHFASFTWLALVLIAVLAPSGPANLHHTILAKTLIAPALCCFGVTTHSTTTDFTMVNAHASERNGIKATKLGKWSSGWSKTASGSNLFNPNRPNRSCIWAPDQTVNPWPWWFTSVTCQCQLQFSGLPKPMCKLAGLFPSKCQIGVLTVQKVHHPMVVDRIIEINKRLEVVRNPTCLTPVLTIQFPPWSTCNRLKEHHSSPRPLFEVCR